MMRISVIFTTILILIPGARSDEMMKVRNAAEAVDACIAYLQKNYGAKAPAASIQWRAQTIFSGGPVDLATTSKQFTSDAWSIEVSEGLAPLRNIVYQVTVFSPTLKLFWKGSVKADGSVKEESSLKQLSEEEKQKMATEFLRKSQNPSPKGGYGH